MNITTPFIEKCQIEFDKYPANLISKNAISAIGSTIATTDSSKLNEVNHIFLNSIKRKHIKSTNQGQTGRCWMFSGLNIFRHTVIRALNLDNFEWSETYLFFWDKFERANVYLQWFIDNDCEINDQSFQYITNSVMCDGGFWNNFVNIVNKYGLVPKHSMKETFQSSDSEDMNTILEERLQACSNYIYKNKKLSKTHLMLMKKNTLTQIYSILVKFLGEPPKTFGWFYTTCDDESFLLKNQTPIQFKELLFVKIKLEDFILICNIPCLEYGKMYEILYTKNVNEKSNCVFLNLEMKDLIKYTLKSVLKTIPVWFASDVRKDFNPYHSVLDDKLSSEAAVFGDHLPFNKGDRIIFNNTQATHAMTIIGVNFDKVGRRKDPVNWQVENSWGYLNHEIPGEDGFLTMSNSWFEKNVLQIVIYNKFLSKFHLKKLTQPTIKLNPWDNIPSALNIKTTHHFSNKRRKI
jgi:bleomycin hydrolase